jgi:hypothetical protein
VDFSEYRDGDAALAYEHWTGLRGTKREGAAKADEYRQKVKSWGDLDADGMRGLLEALKKDHASEGKFKTKRTHVVGMSEDAEAAYEQLPVLKWEENCVALWDPNQNKYRYFCLPYLSFGNVHSVFHWCAFSALYAHVFRYYGLIADVFVDDFNALERSGTADSCREFMRNVFSWTGLKISKQKSTLGSVHKMLGLTYSFGDSCVIVDASHYKRKKLSTACKGLREKKCDERDWREKSDVDDVQKIVGLAVHVMCSTHCRAGKHTWSYLFKVLNTGKKVDPKRVSEALEQLSKLAFAAPPLVLRPERFAGKAVHLYTDASLKKLGAVLFDEDTRLAFSINIPRRWLEFGKRVQNPVMCYEAIAVWTAATTFAGELAGRRIYIWIDNSSVKDSLQAGYCKGESEGGEKLNEVVGAMHRQFLLLNAHIYFVYCNTMFNIADILTRDEWLSLSAEFDFDMVDAVVPV